MTNSSIFFPPRFLTRLLSISVTLSLSSLIRYFTTSGSYFNFTVVTDGVKTGIGVGIFIVVVVAAAAAVCMLIGLDESGSTMSRLDILNSNNKNGCSHILSSKCGY